MPRDPFDDEILGKAFDARLARKSFAFVLPHKGQLAIALLAMLVTAGVSLVPPYLMKAAIDEGMKKGSARVLIIVSLAYLCLFLVRWACQYWQSMSVSMLGQKVVFDIRQKLFSHIQSLSLDFFDKREVGRIISRLTSDVNAINGLVTSGSLSVITDLATLIGIVVIMLKMNVTLSLMTFGLMPFFWIVSALFRDKSRLAYREVRRKVATVTAHVAESVSGVRVVKSFSREKENLRRFKEVNRENRDAIMHAVILSAMFWPTIEVISWVGIATIYWYGGMRVIQGQMTLGLLVAFVGYMHRFIEPIRSMSTLYQNMQDAMAGAERVFEILDTEPTIKDAPGAADLPPIKGEVEFDNVSFGYGDTLVLKDISFRVKPGQTVAIVGPTGAGKTTIVNLLARQYDVSQGAIRIDGIDIREVTVKSLRRQMGVVLQESFLFPDSVKENIRYGRLDATDEEVMEAAKVVGADTFVAELPEGYDTDVREGGTKLSGGQKQVISFARALLADPRILILDEATASVDTRAEALIQNALRELLKGRTSFVIAHRLSTIVEADCILVVEDGRIVERGTHAELLENNGLYRKLYDMQFNFQIPETSEAVPS